MTGTGSAVLISVFWMKMTSIHFHGDRQLPSSEKLAQFREDPALCISNRSCSLYKLNNIPQSNMLLMVWGSGEQASTIGELAVCQVESLLTAYTEKTDKNSFMQNLLLDRYSQVEAFNKAARLHMHLLSAVQSFLWKPSSTRTKMPWLPSATSFLPDTGFYHCTG